MPPKESGQNNAKVFDPDKLLEMSKDNPALRNALTSLIRNVVERAPRQFHDARLAWEDGRVEEAARLLHTMRGTIGTMGAPRFAEMARELESAIQASQESQGAKMFDATQLALNETIAAAAAFLEAEAQPVSNDKETQAASVFKSARDNPGPGEKNEPKLSDWFERMRSDIQGITNDIRQLKQDMTGLALGQIPATRAAAAPLVLSSRMTNSLRICSSICCSEKAMR